MISTTKTWWDGSPTKHQSESLWFQGFYSSQLHLLTSSYPGWIKSPHVVTLGILKFLGGGYSGVNFGHPKSEVFRNGGGYSGVNFGHPKSEVFRNGGVFRSKHWSSQIWSFPKWGGYSGVNFGHPKSEVFRNVGEGYSGVQFQKGVFWKIWTKIYCSARNLLVHHSSLSHTTYVETNEFVGRKFISLAAKIRLLNIKMIIISNAVFTPAVKVHL